MCSKYFGLICRDMLSIIYDSICRMNLPSFEPYKWILSSFNCGNLRQAKNSKDTISTAVQTPLFSHLTYCPASLPPPPLQPKLGLTNLTVNNLFTQNPNLVDQIADQLGIARKEYHGKYFEGRQCSKLLSCSASLKEVVPPSDPPLVECLEKFHRVVVGVSGQTVDPETKDNVSTFQETFMGAMRTQNPRMTQKVHMLIQNMCAVPQLHLGLILSRRWRASINFLIFPTTDSKWNVRTLPSFENVYWMLFYIVTRALYI